MSESDEILSDKNKKYLLVHARWAISNSLFPGLPPPAYPVDLPAENFNLFISLKRRGDLRGFSGSIDNAMPLMEAIEKYAIEATRDPDFPPVALAELPAIVIEISVISNITKICTTTPVHLFTALKPKIHGLILRDQRKNANFLPEMWQLYEERKVFVNAIMDAGGWNQSPWPIGIDGICYQTISFKEEYARPHRA